MSELSLSFYCVKIDQLIIHLVIKFVHIDTYDFCFVIAGLWVQIVNNDIILRPKIPVNVNVYYYCIINITFVLCAENVHNIIKRLSVIKNQIYGLCLVSQLPSWKMKLGFE